MKVFRSLLQGIELTWLSLTDKFSWQLRAAEKAAEKESADLERVRYQKERARQREEENARRAMMPHFSRWDREIVSLLKQLYYAREKLVPNYTHSFISTREHYLRWVVGRHSTYQGWGGVGTSSSVDGMTTYDSYSEYKVTLFLDKKTNDPVRFTVEHYGGEETAKADLKDLKRALIQAYKSAPIDR
jgi:hypothetical protein